VQYFKYLFARFLISCPLCGPKSADKPQGETTAFRFDVKSNVLRVKYFQYLRNLKQIKVKVCNFSLQKAGAVILVTL